MTALPTLHLSGFGMPGPLEMAVIAVFLLLIFGPKRLPELAKAIGGSINIFKESMSGSGDNSTGGGRYVEREDEDDEPRSVAGSIDSQMKANVGPAKEVEAEAKVEKSSE